MADHWIQGAIKRIMSLRRYYVASCIQGLFKMFCRV